MSDESAQQPDTPQLPFVSVIVPCREERTFIRRCLESVLANDYPPERLEIFVVDGMSRDGTRKIVDQFASNDPRVHVIENRRLTVPAALNLGISKARGDVIVRMDAHIEYPTNYISSLVEWLEETGADNVGGVCVTRPSRNTATARAIAAALSHPFAIGNARFRIGTNEPRAVDTVPFGCFRREVFDRVGLFDEELIRNQDDEFNHRLLRSGGKVLLVPGVVSYYYSRASLRELARMFFQYGYFKPLANRKLGAVMTVRQIVPALFVSSLLVLGMLAPFFALAGLAFAATLGSYLVLDLVTAIWVMRHSGVKTTLLLALVFPVIHVAYGVGYLRGIVRFLVFRRSPPEMPMSRSVGMRVAILTQYYPPETGAAQVRLSSLARAFVALGHAVTVMTGMPSYPQGKRYRGYPRFAMREEIDGVEVIRSFSYATQSPALVPRLFQYLSFAVSSLLLSPLRLARPDFLIVESPPLVLGLTGILLSRLKRCRMIFNISDLWPETAVCLGVIRRGGMFHRFSEWLEARCYRSAWLVTGQARETVEDIARRFPWCQTRLLSHGVDTVLFRPHAGSEASDDELGRMPECVAMYTGLHGLAQGLDLIVEAADLLRDTAGLQITLIGDGPEKSRLVRDVEDRGIRNIRFLESRPHSEVAPLISQADFIIVPLVRYIRGAVPSKLFEAMASARPVVLVAEGEAARIVKKYNAGIVVKPGDAKALASAFDCLRRDPDLRRELGSNGRAAVEEHYDRRRIGSEFVELLEWQVESELSATSGVLTRASGGKSTETSR